MLHDVVGEARWIADRAAMVRHWHAGQRLAPHRADELRCQVGVRSDNDVCVPVTVCPFVDCEVLEAGPETAEPTAEPPQKPSES